MLERLFKLREHKTSVRTELLGGATTFATMAYIIVVNPAILANAGLVLHPLMKLTTGRVREITPGGALLGLVCLLYFIYGRPR